MKVIAVLLAFLIVPALIVAAISIPAFILMILLGVLASLTGWACAIGFLPCFVIVLILGLFLD